jgi:hypothetical protein
MSFAPPNEPREEPKPFIPENEEELELWTRFVCAALSSGKNWDGGFAAIANHLVLERRKLRQRMAAQSAYRR